MAASTNPSTGDHSNISNSANTGNSNGGGLEKANGGRSGVSTMKNSTVEPTQGGRRHNSGISLDWTPEEQLMLQDLLAKLASVGRILEDKDATRGAMRSPWWTLAASIRVGWTLEAKDATRGALRSPWWILGCKYQEVVKIAQRKDEQIEYIKEKVMDEGRQEDLKKGKEPAQIAVDEAAF